MFEKYLERLIKQKLGAFIEGLDQNQFTFGVSQAHIYLENVKLKQDALTKLNLPIQIELGQIKKLEITIPWRKIGSTPVEITIDGLNLIVTPQKKFLWQIIDIYDQTLLENAILQIANDQLYELSKSEHPGYFEKLTMKVLDNMQIKIRNVHFRLEDHFTGDIAYTFGIAMKSLDIFTTNENWVPQFFDRSQNNQQNLYKILKIEEFGFYLNPSDTFIIHQQTVNQENRVQMMDVLYQSDDSIIKKNTMSYVLNPSNFQLIINKLNSEFKSTIRILDQKYEKGRCIYKS